MGVAAWTSWREPRGAKHGQPRPRSPWDNLVSADDRPRVRRSADIGGAKYRKADRRNIRGSAPARHTLEGPFINPTKRGTHKSAHVRNPDMQLFREWNAASGSAIRLLTLAPELPGAAELIEGGNAIGHSCRHGSLQCFVR